MKYQFLLLLLLLNLTTVLSNPSYKEKEFMDAHLRMKNHSHYKSQFSNDPLKIHMIFHTHDDVTN